jgi:hypothetical protein
LNRYYATYTGIIEMIILLMPAIIAIQVIGAQRAAERSPAEAAAEVAGYAERQARRSAWIQSRRRRLTGLGVTVMLAGAGVYFTGIGLLAGDRVSVDAGALERGEQPAGRWAEVTGRLIGTEAISISTRRSHGIDVFIPLVSPEWDVGEPVRVYLKTPLESVEDPATGRYEGMLAANDLPGVAITAFAEQRQPPADRYWVLEHRATPSSKIGLGYAMFAAAGVAGLITALAWLIAGRRERAAARRAA